jgi:hypothetical protein
MLKAARVHGRPIMVIAMTMAAIIQPIAIHRPPNTIHRRLRRKEVGDINYPRGGGNNEPHSQVLSGSGGSVASDVGLSTVCADPCLV